MSRTKSKSLTELRAELERINDEIAEREEAEKIKIGEQMQRIFKAETWEEIADKISEITQDKNPEGVDRRKAATTAGGGEATIN